MLYRVRNIVRKFSLNQFSRLISINKSKYNLSSSCICGFRTCLSICPAQSADTWKQIDDIQDLAPYLGSSSDNILSMLQFGNLVAGEHFLDIGAGDGRVLLEAIHQDAATATGYELSEDVYRLGLSHIESELRHDNHLMSRCRLLHQDALQVDIHRILQSYDLITMFLLPRGLAKVVDRINKALSIKVSTNSTLKSYTNVIKNERMKCTRIVTQGWPLPGVSADSRSQFYLHDTKALSGGSILYLYHIHVPIRTY